MVNRLTQLKRSASASLAATDKFIRTAVGKGATPTRTATDSLVLRDGRQCRELARSTGGLTPAVRLWQDIAGQKLEHRGIIVEHRPTRDNNREYILVRANRREVRRYDASRSDWRYTALGKKLFKNRVTEYVVHVPTAPPRNA